MAVESEGIRTKVLKSYYDKKLKKTVLSGTEIDVDSSRIKVLAEKGFIDPEIPENLDKGKVR